MDAEDRAVRDRVVDSQPTNQRNSRL
jgi:hypothetical protein